MQRHSAHICTVANFKKHKKFMQVDITGTIIIIIIIEF